MKRRADYNVQTLEDQILVDVQEALRGINQLKSGISGLKTQLNNFSKNNGLSNFNKQAKQSTSILDALKKTINFSAIYLGAKQTLSTLKDMTNESVDYAETVNLFNVSFGKDLEGLNQYYEKALNFQEKLEEKLGVNIEESMRYQALFNSMTKSMELSAEYAYTLSENTTKLGYDLASLYNIDTESAMTKLRAGLAGQTEPLRELGLDITEQSLKPVAESLGITESIRNMTQAEKTVLRYIAVLRQAQIAQGDFARTMDSPANQLRIFNAQVTAFKRNMGNLWQGILGGILPYVNAVMMVINELLKMVAKLFGFEISSQPINVSESIGAGDLANDLGTASGKAKELKAQLMGFDEIHNITLDDTGSGGGVSGGTSIGGIDQRLLDAMEEYDNLMDRVSNKATEIRDKMLAWLGFERDDDGTWKLKEGLTNFEKILDIVKLIGFAIGTWKVSSFITNLLKNLGILNTTQAFQIAFGITLTLTGLYAQYKGTEHLLDGDVDLFTILETLLGTAGGTWGIAQILKNTAIGKKMTMGQRLQISFGIMLAIQSVQVLADGINSDDIKKQMLGALELGIAAGNVLTSIGGWKFGVKGGLTISLLIADVMLAINEIKWLDENFDEQLNKMFPNKTKEELDLGENLQVGLGAIGQGATGSLGIDTTSISDWLAEQMQKAGVTPEMLESNLGIREASTRLLGYIIEDTWNSLVQLGLDINKEVAEWFANTEVGKWLTENVLIWFTKEKWEQEFNNIKLAIQSKWQEIVDWWNTLGIVKWWDEYVAPWFTKEKWEQEVNNAKTGIENKFNEFKNNFTPIQDWWNEKIAPWFDFTKWKDKSDDGTGGISAGFNEWKQKFNPIFDWWNEKIAPWFTWEKWRQLGLDAVQGIQNAFSNFNFTIKMPHFSWSQGGIQAPSWAKGVLEALNLPTTLPKLTVSWYESGGLPTKGELFIAREAGPELVGRMGSKNAVANNGQIVEGIKQGVYEAVVTAMSQQSGGTSKVQIIADEKGIFKVVQEKAQEYAVQTGENPFPNLA